MNDKGGVMLAASTERLAAALHDALCYEPVGECMCGPDDMDEVARALLASGAVVPAASLADEACVLIEQAAVEQLACFDTVMNVSAEARGVVDRFRALAAALEDHATTR